MRRWLGWFALAVIVGMQAGTVFKPLGTVGGAGLVLLIGWGIYWLVADGSVFPQFSELGWI